VFRCEISGKRGVKREKVQINEYLDLIEAPVGFEPTNKGFADLRLKPLGYSALKTIKSTNVELMERETGLEPATSTLARLRSTN
jgi:hypothetical protein